MESQIGTNASSNLDDNLPKSREDFGYDIEVVLEKVILRVEKMYPKEDIDKLLQDGKKQQAHEMLAKAFGKFLAEVEHVCYKPDISLLTSGLTPNKKQETLSIHYAVKEDDIEIFVNHYNIKTDLAFNDIEKFMSNASGGIEKPQLRSKFNFLLGNNSTPLPKQTLERLLGYDATEIPPKYQMDRIQRYNQQTRCILKPKKEIGQTNIKQITETGEAQATSSNATDGVLPNTTNNESQSTTEKKQEYQDNETLKETAVGTGAAGVATFIASGAACLIENAEKADNHKASITLASIGTALGLSAIATWIAGKSEAFKKPKTQIKTYILDKEYELDLETFLGIRRLLLDGKNGDYFPDEPGKDFDSSSRVFFQLKDLIDGTHEKLPELFPDEIKRNLYITISKSYIESHYNMMCEFPEIIEQRMKYKEDARDSRDIDHYAQKAIYNYRDETKAEFVRH